MTEEKEVKNTNPFDEESSEEIVSGIEKEINVLDPTPNVKEVVLTHPVTGETKTFNQKELAFIPKTRLLSLVATTIRAASDSDNGNGNVGDLVSDMFGGVNDLIGQGVDQQDAENYATNQFLEIIIRLVEIAPDFLDQLYILVLNVKPKDRQWVIDSLEIIDDEQGIDILDTAIAQNGDALKDFFNKHLRRVANRAQTIWATEEDTAQE